MVISPSFIAVKIPLKSSKTSKTIATSIPNMRGIIMVTLAINPFKRILLTSLTSLPRDIIPLGDDDIIL